MGVEVDDRIVTLTGTVTSYAKRLAAQEAAHRVDGVLDVANDIRVRPPNAKQLTDTDIARQVRVALELNVEVPAQRIQSTVSNGWVLLEGDVDAWHECEEAERAIHHLAGVRGITSEIQVLTQESAADDVRAEIEAALERRAERAARHVRVELANGTVTLTGPVRSGRERKVVLGAARYTPGVKAVVDRLHLDHRS